jgi:tRNA A-37 threonylcarbamoyl transferase component Bud32/tetratricopeptide (TPR) repeat protein
MKAAMNSEVRSLFHELVDRSPAEREQMFQKRRVTPELRAEVESLLQFDAAPDKALTGRVAKVAESLLTSGATHETGLCGPYRLGRLLGSGGMGAVYLAERIDGAVEQTVAVKLLRHDEHRPLRQERFLQERQFLASLKHPSIVHLIDAGSTENGRPYLVMEYVDGVPIDVYCAGTSVSQRLRLFLEVCEGVSHAHQHLIIHRDLKPSNILVDASGQPKLLDFGIAKVVDDTGASNPTTEFLLTPGYASPEQINGTLQTTATDVYSLGAVLYKLLTGRSPHDGDRVADRIAGRSTIVPATRLDPSLPGDVDSILSKALRQEPEERYVSVEAFANDVASLLDSKPVAARAGDRWYRMRKFVRRHRVPVAAVALVIASLAGGLYIANRQRLIAERRFAQLRELSNSVIDLDIDLANLASATPARMKIVATSKRYLEGLGKDAAGDTSLSLEIAEAYLRLARIQGVSMGHHLAQYAEAEKSLAQADAFAMGVLARHPRDRIALRKAANIAHDRAMTAESETRPIDVSAHAREASDRLERLVKLGNLTRPEVNNVAYMYANLAQFHINMNRYDEAVRYARLGVDVSRGVESIPGPRAQAHCLLANSLRAAGDLNGAEENLREAQRLVEHGKFDNQRYRSQILVRVLVLEGRILGEEDGVNMNRPQEAAAAFGKAFDLSDSMCRSEPKDNYSRAWVAIAGHNYANLLTHTDAKAAFEIYDRTLARNREIANDPTARRVEATLLADSSYAARATHQTQLARQRIDEAFRLLKETKDYPTDKLEPGGEAETVLRALASHYADTGEPAKAVDTYREVLTKIAAAGGGEEKSLPVAVLVSRSYEAVSPLLRRLGKMDEAADVESKWLELWHGWDRKLPGNPFIQRQLEAATRP